MEWTLTTLKNHSDAEIRSQIDKLQASLQFAGSDRLILFLKFIVEETLRGNGPALREATIGNQIYRREPPYDPRIDSTVRVEARRLRRKLDEYYRTEGQTDPIIIKMPSGSYQPIFENRPKNASSPIEDNPSIFETGPGAFLAILPIRSLSPDLSDETFADGLTDELIHAFGQSSGLHVTSRNIVFQYKQSNFSFAELAHDLNADVFLQGAVRHERNQYRITIELSDRKGFILWAERFDVPDDDKMRLQEKISTTMASRARIDHSQMRAMTIKPSVAAIEANSRIYRARQMLDQQTPACLQKALELFEQVARATPEYSRGHSGIADCYCDLFRLGLTDFETAYSKAKFAIDHALTADPDSVEGLCSSAYVAAWFENDFTFAEATYKKALYLGDNARAIGHYGLLLTFLSRHDEALQLFEEARQVDAFSTHQQIIEAFCHYQARRFHQLTTLPTNASTSLEILACKAIAHLFCEERDQAETLLSQFKNAAAKYPSIRFIEFELAARLGRPAQAQARLDGADHTTGYFALAALASALQEAENSISLVQKAIADREASTIWLQTDARFDWLRGNLQFAELIHSMSKQHENDANV